MKKVAIVTGATRGIGKVTARTLAAHGFAVIVTGRTLRAGEGDLGSPDQPIPVPGSIEETVVEIEAAGGEALGVRLDLLDRGSIDAAVDQVMARYGRIDVLVNNAIYQGPGVMAPVSGFSMKEAEDSFLGTVINQVHLSRRVMAAMIPAGGGRLVFVTSLSSVMPATGGWGFLYGAGKAAFNKIPEFIQFEHGDEGLLAFLVEPRFTLTDTIEARWGEDALSVGGDSRPRRPEETADTIAWLATAPDASRFAGGAMINAPDFFVENGITPPSPSVAG